MNRKGDITEILKKVQKPGRYIGGEFNSIVKDSSRVKARVALVFPDLYEVGMSYLGQKILYALINRYPEYAAERVFAPWEDMEDELRSHHIPLFSLETRRPLYEFDLLGFSLLYELNYSNVLTILDLGKIPFRSEDRKEGHPLIGAGGPAAFNPEPVADIFDFFLIGDGEEGFLEILDKIAGYGGKKGNREELLKELSSIHGVYVPRFYETRLSYPGGLKVVTSKSDTPPFIRKRIQHPFDRSFFPEKIIVPHVSAVFDRVSIEAARGCPQGCRFCQAFSIYFPPRIKDPCFVQKNTFGSLKCTGYDEASLASLSISDYPYLEKLVETLMEGFKEKSISLSLSSLRPQGLSAKVVENILQVRKTGITIVPEAGTERLRRVINKRLEDEEIFQAVAEIFSRGWKLIKLYFMVGLPSETEDDLDGIIRMVDEIIKIGRCYQNVSPGLNISISSFIPKPHTPFQWLAMEKEDILKEKHHYLRNKLKKYRKVKIRQHPLKNSVLEGIFSRGDRRLNDVLIEAWKKGVRFDSWGDKFDFDIWLEAFEKVGVDPQTFLNAIPLDKNLPWDHIRTGIKKVHLLSEWERSKREIFTLSCWEKKCGDCLGCDVPHLIERDFGRKMETAALKFSDFGDKSEDVVSYRATYEKTGDARFLSHLEMSNAIQRSLRRAGIPVVCTQGFHPKMKISYLPALPLGMKGYAERLDFSSQNSFSKSAFLDRINGFLPKGLMFSDIKQLPPGTPKLNDDLEAAVYVLETASPEMKGKIPQKRKMIYSALDSWGVDNGRGPIEKIGFDEENKFLWLRFSYRVDRPTRIQDIIQKAFGCDDAIYALSRREIVLRSEKNNRKGQPEE
ncbi:MAG: TIGR03960 family B12-binding radical SAM protein [Candidatus Aminicenantes bacterium]|nr:TIGR03960 family B12-binding radical SAM protein [Candidatus Aminicenantes bacterium]